MPHFFGYLKIYEVIRPTSEEIMLYPKASFRVASTNVNTAESGPQKHFFLGGGETYKYHFYYFMLVMVCFVQLFVQRAILYKSILKSSTHKMWCDVVSDPGEIRKVH